MGWIKVQEDLPNRGRIGAIARSMGCDLDSALGVCVRFWIVAGQQTADGVLDYWIDADIDARMGRPGLAKALRSVGWLADHERGLVLPNFTEHNGDSARKRALDASRQASARTRVTEAVQKTSRKQRDESVTKRKSKRQIKTEDPIHSGGAASRTPAVSGDGQAALRLLGETEQEPGMVTAPKQPKTTNPNHPLAVKMWQDRYGGHYRHAPAFDGREARALARILECLRNDLMATGEVFDRYLGLRIPFYAGHPLWKLADNIQTFLTDEAFEMAKPRPIPTRQAAPAQTTWRRT